VQHNGHALPTLVVSATDRVPDAIQALKGGAVDFIRKPFEREALLRSVDALLQKSRTDFQLAAEQAQRLNRRQSLSPRELQVMDKVVGGFSNREIAVQLGISERTVEVHRAKVMTKMAAVSVADLVEQAVALRSAGSKPGAPPAGPAGLAA
jgi:FixJ family two-component response regulator